MMGMKCRLNKQFTDVLYRSAAANGFYIAVEAKLEKARVSGCCVVPSLPELSPVGMKGEHMVSLSRAFAESRSRLHFQTMERMQMPPFARTLNLRSRDRRTSHE